MAENETAQGLHIKKYVFIAIIISVVISTILNIAITIFFNNSVKLSDFKIESFNMETETETYSSFTSTTYEGTGKITCSDTSTDYVVLIEEVDTANNTTQYTTNVVHNGIGKISTYNYSGSSKTIKKPEYTFNIIGFRSFNK